MPNVYAVVFSVPHEMGDTLWSVHTCPDKADEAKAKAERGEGYAGSYGTFAIRVLRMDDASADGGRPVCSARTKAGRRCRRAADWSVDTCKQHATPVVLVDDTAPGRGLVAVAESFSYRTEVRGVWLTDGEGRTVGEGEGGRDV
ncbi:MAG: hypothetical protein KAQ88_11040 [Hyphomicrobiaceae bacterium]|nr:hypothetical protein [Hyphomicrobiaceae bacterium]